MPEASSALRYSYVPEPPKKTAMIKVSCGIGDTDGFPAFDIESDAYASKDDPKWGFLITGGAEFHMPLTVFQVTPDGLADKGGIRLGDIILEINEEDAAQLTLAQAHEKIDASGKKIHFLVKCMDEEEGLDGFQPGEEKSIVLRVPKPMGPLKAAASIEVRLREMQRKLSEIAEIPKILSSTLATVSQTFSSLMLEDHEQQLAFASGRKYSYDEDAIDYELSDGEEDERDWHLSLRHAEGEKSATPESDYASEANYVENDADDVLGVYHAAKDDDDDQDGGDDDDEDYVDEDEDDDDDYRNGDGSDDELEKSGTNEYTEAAANDHYDIGVDESDDDANDFLNATYTWNLRNVPKLQLNDELTVHEAEEENKDADETDHEDNYRDSGAIKRKSGAELFKVEASPEAHNTVWDQKPEKDEKLERFERSWPWADREKIIYKQSTCHLVRRKPLGLVEQRKQLLAKQNLMDSLQARK